MGMVLYNIATPSFMSSVVTPGFYTNDTTNCPNGICNTTKAYLKIIENTVK